MDVNSVPLSHRMVAGKVPTRSPASLRSRATSAPLNDRAAASAPHSRLYTSIRVNTRTAWFVASTSCIKSMAHRTLARDTTARGCRSVDARR